MRRIVLQLADDTDETHCGSCNHVDVDVAKLGMAVCAASWSGINREDDGRYRRSLACRSAELRPETVEAIRTALETFVLVSETDDEKPALADFDRLFGGGE